MSPTNFFITGAHGLTLVRSKYYKGFLLNSISCLLKNKKFVWHFRYGQHSWSYTSQKKKKIYFNWCIICQSYNSSLEITKSILQTSLVTLIDRCKKHSYYKHRKFTGRIENFSVFDIIKQIGFYHRECYKTFRNLNEVKKPEKLFNGLNNDKQSAQIMLDRKFGRPSFKQCNQLEYEKLPMLRRLQSEICNKKLYKWVTKCFPWLRIFPTKVFIGALMLYQLLMMPLPIMSCITILAG